MRTGNLNIEGYISGSHSERTDDNIMLNAFRIAINGSLTQQNMVDGIVDEYEDETGIDTSSSINEVYDSGSNFYQNLATLADITSDTKLMLHCNGLDESGNNHHITFKGNPKVDKTTYKFGEGSLSLDGTGDYLSTPTSTDWDIWGSTSDSWTISFWVKHVVTNVEHCYMLQRVDDNNYWYFAHLGASSRMRFKYSKAGTEYQGDYFSTIADSNWHHVSICKVNAIAGMYLDGTQVTYLNMGNTNTYNSPLYIGSLFWDGSPSWVMNGNLDSILISHSNIFSASPNTGNTDTITIPTSAHTSDANTKLLLNFPYIDISGDGGSASYHQIDFNEIEIDTTTKKWGSGAYQFDGSSSYISISDSADWDICGSNVDNWTIDFWVKHTDYSGDETYMSQYEDSSNYWVFDHASGAGVRFWFRSNGGEMLKLNYASAIADTDWHHLAMCKVADEYAIYKDGTQISYTQDSDTDTLSGQLRIGTENTNYYFDGYMDEIRIQHSNIFSASPNSGKTDTITIPISEYTDVSATFNMSLFSNTNTASVEPDTARIVVFEEDVDSITINTDLKAYISKDNGSTWAQVTLIDQGNYETGKRILAGTVDLTQSGIGSGTNMKYKITTHNEKSEKIHGAGLLWD